MSESILFWYPNINVVSRNAKHIELGLAVLAHVLLEPLVRRCLLHFFDIVGAVGGAHHFDAVPDRLLDLLVGAATLSVAADEAIKLLPHVVVLLPRVARVRQFVADHLGDLVRRDRIVHHSRAETNVRATGGGWVLAHSATARSAIEDEHVRTEVRLCLLAHPRVVEDALLLVLEDLLGPIAQFVGAFHKKSGGETGIRLTRNRVPLLLRLANGAHRQRLVVVRGIHL